VSSTSISLPNPFPLIGRDAELSELASLLSDAEAAHGRVLVLCGASGVGKSRLLRTCADHAHGRGWRVAHGRAYQVEVGVPYAIFSDALLPLLHGFSPEALATLSRGGEAELAYLFPGLRDTVAAEVRASGDPTELKTRLLWNFAQFLARLSAREPLLLILDDLQWADASSLELLHFLARQLGRERIALLCSYNDAHRDQNPRLKTTEQSLVAMGAARVHEVKALTPEHTGHLIGAVFGVEEATVRDFAAHLYGWTRGNPFFLEETLKSLAERGQLRHQDGTWRGWGLERIELPPSIREAVLTRLMDLSAEGRHVAELLAVIGTSASHPELLALGDRPEHDLVGAVEELRRQRVIDERLDGETVVYDFTHPLLREALYGELGLARAKLLHGRVAAALESFYGARALEHADRLAYQFTRAMDPSMATKAVAYLAVAGRNALAKYANREAADYLGAAVQHAQSAPGGEVDPRLLDDFARARQRLGDFAGAIQVWESAREQAAAAGDSARIARAERRLGLARFWTGAHGEALGHFDAGLDAAARAGDPVLQARLLLAKGECLLEVGRAADAHVQIQEALEIAERVGEPQLLARMHLAMLLLHTWTGPPETAHRHGERALALAKGLGDAALTCTVNWAMTILSGLTGDGPATRRYIEACERLFEELRSPLHRLRVGELTIEFLSNTGEWDAAITLAERNLAAARALNQRAILARVLVWAAIIHLGRGEVELGKEYVDEAWLLSGAGDAERRLDVHTVVPAHVGRTAYHIAVGELEQAVEVGRAGLEIADRSGYTVWAIHRLLPLLAEAHLSMGDLEGATAVGARLRANSERLGHKLGLAWADACDGFLEWLRGDVRSAIHMLRTAAERLEAIPVVPDAARLRRHFAARLRDDGQRDEAIQELRRVHEIFARLGAERELAKTREQIRELGARPPSREVGNGAGALSARELEIARLVAERKSNKTIGRVLDISPRTVSTHLSNIFRKLGVDSRSELSDRVRALELGER
jgi:DNA-binding CsgD family transcriptional regulator